MSSSTAIPSQRSRRARVIIVGPIDASAAAYFVQAPLRASNMFEAIAEVATATSGEVIAAALVHEDLLRGQHQHAAEALRKIDPSLRIVGLVSNAATAPQAGSRGVDAWITLPLRPDELRRALDDDALLAASPPSPAARPSSLPLSEPEEIAAPATIPPAATPPTSPPAPALAEPAQETQRIGPQHPAAAAEAQSPASTANAAPASPAPSPPHQQPAVPAIAPPPPAQTPSRAPQTASAPPPLAAAIGDTDLINAILHDPAGVLPTALRVIAYHTGWNDLGVLDAGDEQSSTASVEIVHGDQRFGRLTSARGAARPAELSLWADWLAHWLAIDHDFRRYRTEAFTDCLTGAGNRRFFEAFLSSAIASARTDRRPLTVMVFDIDDFKRYNDQFGHEAGDEILREIVRLLKSVIRQGDVVCRIGGDEFVVVFADAEPPRALGSKPPENVQQIAQRFQAQVSSMRFPKLGAEAQGSLSISAGLATYPWDGADPQSLLRHADQLALESKRKGKNALTLGRRDSL